MHFGLVLFLVFLGAILAGKALRRWVERPYTRRPVETSAAVGTVVVTTTTWREIGPPSRKVEL